MREPGAVRGETSRRGSFPWLFAVCLALNPLLALAQQPSSSGAIETFEPTFDVGVVMRPRAGIYGITELMMAALEADLPKARRFLDAGADVNARDDSGSTALMWAAHGGDVSVVNLLIASGADIHAKAHTGATALINAIAARREAAAVALIDAGADPNGRGNAARNFLETAAESGMSEVVAALIRNGTDLSGHGASALAYAVSRGHYEVAVLLLDAGVDPRSPAASSEYSLLARAASSGNPALVQLLLSHGADATEPSGYGSPLRVAVDRGHGEIAALLIDNGAPVTSNELLASLRRPAEAIAMTLLDHTDLDSFTEVELAALLAAADELNDEEINRSLRRSASVREMIEEGARKQAADRRAASRSHARLLFAREHDDGCVIGIWDSRSGETSELASIATCPDDLFVSQDRDSIFVLDGNAIQVLSVDGRARGGEVILPDLDYRAWLGQMDPRPDQNPDYLPSMPDLRPIGIGRFDDGALGLVVSLWMPADDEFHYLFRREAGQWSIVEAHWCDRWGCAETIDSLDFISSNVWSWPESSMIWHENLRLNPYFVDESVELIDLEYESYQATVRERTFEIDGVGSVLRFSTSPSEHSDTNHTFGINLAIGAAEPVSLSENQCLTSLVGRYLLVNEFFGGRFEVTDIGTGKSVVADLQAAMWLD